MINKNARPSLEQQAARIAHEAATLGMDAPTLQILLSMNEHLKALRDQVTEVQESVSAITPEKDWYTTSDLAELTGLSRQHISERWCNQARVECEKDPKNGQWRIPGHEYARLKRGGKPLPTSPGRVQG